MMMSRQRVAVALMSLRRKGVILNTCARIPPEALLALDAEDAIECGRFVRIGASRIKAALPAIRMAGPLTQAATAAGICHASGLRGRKPVAGV